MALLRTGKPQRQIAEALEVSKGSVANIAAKHKRRFPAAALSAPAAHVARVAQVIPTAPAWASDPRSPGRRWMRDVVDETLCALEASVFARLEAPLVGPPCPGCKRPTRQA